ncbi:MAG: diacylglycerol kinase [Lactobacillales bacterium]|jgi:diacylglycerol kinase (ATP)|nr:diacylglycerol kinase [Lactobacillales bacterium]
MVKILPSLPKRKRANPPRARVIYNPTSGNETMKQHLVEVLDCIESLGYETSAFATTAEPHSALNEAYRAGRTNFELIVVCGGDGTINEVISGIAPLRVRPKVAIIPAGTTNDYARALKIPRNDVAGALEIIKQQETFKIDIGRANDSYFINIAAGGFLSDVTYEVPSQLKTIFGHLAYLAKGIEFAPRIKPVNLRVQYDGGEFNGKASMFFCALTNSVGGFEKIVPDATLDDGKFSLIIVKTSNVFKIVNLLLQLINTGNHVNDPEVLYVKTRHVTVAVEGEDQMKVNLDGEYGGTTPATFTNLMQHIEIFANVAEIHMDKIVGIGYHDVVNISEDEKYDEMRYEIATEYLRLEEEIFGKEQD